MPRSLLPPRGLFLQTDVIFNQDIAPVLRDTWIQLRALAWGQDETPPISIKEIATLTGKSEKTIYGHLSLLRSSDALRWHPSKRGTIIVEFRNCRFSDSNAVSKFSEVDNSENLELPVIIITNNNNESLIDSVDDSFNGGVVSENSENHSENSEYSGKPELKTLRDAERIYCQVTGFAAVTGSAVPYLERILDMIQKYGEDETRQRMSGAWGGWLKSKRKDGAPYGRTNPAWIDYAIAGDAPGRNGKPTAQNGKYESSGEGEHDLPEAIEVDPATKDAWKDWNKLVVVAMGKGIEYDEPGGGADWRVIQDHITKLRAEIDRSRYAILPRS